MLVLCVMLDDATSDVAVELVVVVDVIAVALAVDVALACCGL